MTLIKFEPLKEFETFNNRIQRFFNDFPNLGSELGFAFNPQVDISGDDKNVYLEIEVPGVKKEDIKISLQDNILTISGEKKKEEQNKNSKYFRSERVYGSFTRSFTLPEDINYENVDAVFENGTLKIKIEKAQPAVHNERIIDIK